MKAILRNILIVSTLFTVSANAQRVRISAAAGGSAYYGDLIAGSPLLKQVSGAVTLGGSYDLSNQLRLRASLSGLGVQGDDKDNPDQKFKNRNLNFKSFIWELNVAAEYDFLNNVEEYSFTPYVFFGPGIFGFNPTTTDRFGEKQKLRDWGTEGQGLAAYPDRKPYALTQFNLGFGAGIRIDLSEALQVGTELFIRKTFTDYLDDVSTNGYVDPALFTSQGNAFSQYLAFRGDEVGATFSKTIPRGNPNRSDLYYSFQIKFTYKLLNVEWGGPTGFFGGGGGGFGARNKMRNPRSVL
ncbi:MAG TPA: DUF6089 family protein [Chitinophagaceae bacterium]|jgi:hypothetical protein|nr:outer membrane beta-barrel protein [Chitinophagaceae bacterium]MBP9739830.1 outer membrane beta-barrel protein [Chitinophagaceae bacterium]HPH24725.1 DUF6089 family protein [Chitinophagaceae bacterium]